MFLSHKYNHTLEGVNDFMTLFTTYFNFLRNHTSLDFKPTVQLDYLKKTNNIPSKWNFLLDKALDFHMNITYGIEL